MTRSRRLQCSTPTGSFERVGPGTSVWFWSSAHNQHFYRQRVCALSCVVGRVVLVIVVGRRDQTSGDDTGTNVIGIRTVSSVQSCAIWGVIILVLCCVYITPCAPNALPSLKLCESSICTSRIWPDLSFTYKRSLNSYGNEVGCEEDSVG